MAFMKNDVNFGLFVLIIATLFAFTGFTIHYQAVLKNMTVSYENNNLQLETKLAQLEALEKTKSELTKEYTNTIGDLESLDEQYTETRKEKEELKDENAELSDELTKTKSSLAQKTQELISTQNTLAETEDDLDRANTRILQLEEDLNDCEKDLDECENPS